MGKTTNLNWLAGFQPSTVWPEISRKSHFCTGSIWPSCQARPLLKFLDLPFHELNVLSGICLAENCRPTCVFLESWPGKIPISLSLCSSINLSIYLSSYVSIYLDIYLSVKTFTNLISLFLYFFGSLASRLFTSVATYVQTWVQYRERKDSVVVS